MRTSPILFALLWMGCDDKSQPPVDSTPTVDVDEDGDGSPGSLDCDDNDPTVFPDASEVCDGLDNNCDGAVDEGVTTTYTTDADADGYGLDGSEVQACSPPAGSATQGGDCDDTNTAYHPGAEENDCADPNDYNCDGSVGYADNDGDGYAACQECDDNSAAVHPDATELCNNIDDNCDGSTDDPSAADAATWYQDSDSDQFGDADYSTRACTQPEGYTADNTDCEDQNAQINPDATELCNSLDDDCDTLIDDADPSLDKSSGSTFYADTDSDGYGDPAASSQACTQPSGSVSDSTDCDDSETAVNPAATELCNSVDDNCDGTIDEGSAADASTWYADTDGDGYGDLGSSSTACSQPSGAVANSSDCDDSDSSSNPAATELCNGQDDNCDGSVDEDSAADASTWYADLDTDGFGDLYTPKLACSMPSGYSASSTDCDDSDSSAYPGASETCDGVDDDCDTSIDDGVLGTGSSCPADSCYDALLDGRSSDGSYYLEGLSGAVFQAYCDQTRDGGGWTLVGSVVNEARVTGTESRNWNSLSAWTSSSTFGAISTRKTQDYKGQAYTEIPGDDYMAVTDEYGFGFYAVLGYQDFGSFISAEYSSSTCSQTFLASGADWSEKLTATQAAMLNFIVRPLDDNAGTCFPNGNENAILGHHFASCCWANGLGNTPKGYATWQIYDNSLLQLKYLSGGTCTAGKYPCNDIGYYMSGTNDYTYSTKVIYAEMYVR